MDQPEPIPAATVIVLRDVIGGAPELLMVERARAMAFAGGALVFPGGRIDSGDRALASLMPGDPEDMAARVAAVRETLEEAGVAVGVDVPQDAISGLRERVYAGAAMGAELARAGGALRLDALIPFARWLPHGLPQRVFDTRFYLARAPADAAPLVDGNENVRIFWTSARAVLDAADAGEVVLLFPTRRNLERIARFGSFADAVADAHAHAIRPITPWIEHRDGGDCLCIPEDLGYPVCVEPLASVRRT